MGELVRHQPSVESDEMVDGYLDVMWFGTSDIEIKLLCKWQKVQFICNNPTVLLDFDTFCNLIPVDSEEVLFLLSDFKLFIRHFLSPPSLVSLQSFMAQFTPSENSESQ